MSIKRYEMKTTYRGHDSWDSLEEDEEGRYVDYQDYAESDRYGRQADITIENLERKVEQLAAENAAMKAGAIKAIEDIQCFYDSEAWHVSEDGESETAVVALDDAKGSIEHFMLNIQTPATNAILAEVRASGVEMYAENLDSSADDAERDGFDDAVKFLRSEASGVRLFAAQLRREAAK